MHERVDRLPATLVTPDEDLEREFEARLVESSTLAFRVAFGVLRHREDAEDVAQEAFAKAYRSFRQLRDRARFRAWLVRMTWRLALDRVRTERRRSARELVFESDRPTTADDSTLARERAERLWAAIDELPEKLRLVVVLAGIEGHDMKEVSALLDVPEGTVKSRLFIARKRLRERLSWMVTNTPAR
ncbi:MAG TPA: sigma-70 family RNA polymerase sigma factor [Vicinamibacterales bacterium]|nr:sigma-70 family RNA polymerase sigma factor [Vicinamibacterales bacterium]